MTVHDEYVFFSAEIDSAAELTVHSVILEHVSQVVYWAEVIDTYNLDVAAVFYSGAEYETALSISALKKTYSS